MAHTSFFAPTLPMPEHSWSERSLWLGAKLSGVALPIFNLGRCNHGIILLPPNGPDIGCGDLPAWALSRVP